MLCPSAKDTDFPFFMRGSGCVSAERTGTPLIRINLRRGGDGGGGVGDRYSIDLALPNARLLVTRQRRVEGSLSSSSSVGSGGDEALAGEVDGEATFHLFWVTTSTASAGLIFRLDCSAGSGTKVRTSS